MMSTLQALVGATIFDGDHLLADRALLIDGRLISGIVGHDEVPPDIAINTLSGGVLAPGFIDLQVNGGGGVMLNDSPSPGTMMRMANVHRRFGTTGLLPTLITDGAALTEQAIDAAYNAVRTVPGILGLHLEGPHLDSARHGAHERGLIRPMYDAEYQQLIRAHQAIGVLMVTLAPDQVSHSFLSQLAKAGVVLALGHCDADFDTCMRAFSAGARVATHLFNAMSPLRQRAPGLVGAALESGPVWCSIIADGHHVHPATLRTALRAKRPPGRLFLITDAMATVGSTTDAFGLNGRTVVSDGGRLSLADGTLAGSHLDMAGAVRFTIDQLEVPIDEALRMASLYPAMVIRQEHQRGRIAPGYIADLVHLSEAGYAVETWVAGNRSVA